VADDVGSGATVALAFEEGTIAIALEEGTIAIAFEEGLGNAARGDVHHKPNMWETRAQEYKQCIPTKT
jgi:hypothetical protein